MSLTANEDSWYMSFFITKHCAWGWYRHYLSELHINWELGHWHNIQCLEIQIKPSRTFNSLFYRYTDLCRNTPFLGWGVFRKPNVTLGWNISTRLLAQRDFNSRGSPIIHIELRIIGKPHTLTAYITRVEPDTVTGNDRGRSTAKCTKRCLLAYYDNSLCWGSEVTQTLGHKTKYFFFHHACTQQETIH